MFLRFSELCRPGCHAVGAENWGCRGIVGPFPVCRGGYCHRAGISVSELFFSAVLGNSAARGDGGLIQPWKNPLWMGISTCSGDAVPFPRRFPSRMVVMFYPTLGSLGSPWVCNPLLGPFLGEFPFLCSRLVGGTLCSTPPLPRCDVMGCFTLLFPLHPFTPSPQRGTAQGLKPFLPSYKSSL